MKPTESLESFRAHCQAVGVNLEECTPRVGLIQMFSFYDALAPTGCSGRDGDMLVFQWGTYDWGSGKNFELNITRQFVEEEGRDDEAISQLSLTYRFEPTFELEEIKPGNLWCEGPQASSVIREFSERQQAFIIVADQRPRSCELSYSYM